MQNHVTRPTCLPTQNLEISHSLIHSSPSSSSCSYTQKFFTFKFVRCVINISCECYTWLPFLRNSSGDILILLEKVNNLFSHLAARSLESRAATTPRANRADCRLELVSCWEARSCRPLHWQTVEPVQIFASWVRLITKPTTSHKSSATSLLFIGFSTQDQKSNKL